IEAFGELPARPQSVGGDILHPVRHPEVDRRRRFCLPAHFGTDGPASAAVFDPETSHRRFGMSQGKAAVCEWMSEASRIKIEADAIPPAPVNPTLKVAYFDGVAIDRLATEIAVKCVQVQPMTPGEQLQGKLQILLQLRNSPRPPGIVSGNSKPSTGNSAC